jgi:hypothetical protein
MSALFLRLAGDATVRATITADGEHVFSVYDFLDLVCPNSKSYASVTWSRLTDENSVYRDEIKFTMVYLKLQNVGLSDDKKRRFRKTPVMTLQGLQHLLVILGNKVSAEFRQIVLGVFTRYMAGDRSMLQEVEANAVSDAPIHQAYRQALTQEPVTTMANSKPMLDRDEAIFNMELHERQMALHERQMALYERSWTLHEKSLALQRMK